MPTALLGAAVLSSIVGPFFAFNQYMRTGRQEALPANRTPSHKEKLGHALQCSMGRLPCHAPH